MTSILIKYLLIIACISLIDQTFSGCVKSEIKVYLYFIFFYSFYKN